MADLLWPGDQRAGSAFEPVRVLRDMVLVERAWLLACDVAEVPAAEQAESLVVGSDVRLLAELAEGGGNPVIPLVDLLRQRLEERGMHLAATSLHDGLTSQDVMDTAMVLSARAAAEDVVHDLDSLVGSLVSLAERHRSTPLVGRTLTQHARPVTFGLRVAHWLQGVLDARNQVRALRWPGQFAGPVGIGLPQARAACEVLGLDDVPPWHTVRTPFTRYADALVTVTDGLGHIADDVLVLSRTEVGELSEPEAEGRGGSSSMPHKQNPVLSVLIRRAALTTPGLAAQLHLAAADTRDERPDGSWHTEWPTLATISRRTVVATSQTAELVAGLDVHAETMAARVDEPADQVLVDATIDRVLSRAKEEQ